MLSRRAGLSATAGLSCFFKWKNFKALRGTNSPSFLSVFHFTVVWCISYFACLCTYDLFIALAYTSTVRCYTRWPDNKPVICAVEMIRRTVDAAEGFSAKLPCPSKSDRSESTNCLYARTSRLAPIPRDCLLRQATSGGLSRYCWSLMGTHLYRRRLRMERTSN